MPLCVSAPTGTTCAHARSTTLTGAFIAHHALCASAVHMQAWVQVPRGTNSPSMPLVDVDEVVLTWPSGVSSCCSSPAGFAPELLLSLVPEEES